MGATPPAGFDGKTFEKSTTDKAKIVEELNKSWEFAQKTINGMSNADFAKLLPKLGPQANAGDVVYILVADAHEHLGQLVAYARVNGIVPPWTVEAQKKAAEKKASRNRSSTGRLWPRTGRPGLRVYCVYCSGGGVRPMNVVPWNFPWASKFQVKRADPALAQAWHPLRSG